MKKEESILNQFETISLEEMESVNLMNRTDTKFIFSSKNLESVLITLLPHYRILEINSHRLSRYKTLYYDTPELKLYHSQHVGKLNRYKIRHRAYLESNTGFLEVKFKNNKGRTIKTRVKEKLAPMYWEADHLKFLQEQLPFSAQSLVPIIWINYSRLTLVSKTTAERVTIDLDLQFEYRKAVKTFDHLIIAEVKQEKKAASFFLRTMQDYRIREGSISKYCMGIATMVQTVKTNNFKQKLRIIQSITS